MTRQTAMIALIMWAGFFCSAAGTGGDSRMPAEAVPKSEPVLFAPGVVSTAMNERDTALTPDGHTLYFTVWAGSKGVILTCRKNSGNWTEPETAFFSGTYSDLEPAFSPSGNRLYFVSNRPRDGKGTPGDYDIWYLEKSGEQWTGPINPGAPLNSPANEFYPSVTEEGTVYFCADRAESLGGEDILFCRRKGRGFCRAENPGPHINTRAGEFNAFVAPDESYLIYTTTGRKGGPGRGDLWISFRQADSSWTEPLNMGEKLNSPALDYCPYVSPNGKTLFFTSQRSLNAWNPDKPARYADLKKYFSEPGNGRGDIYCISAECIAGLRKKVMKN